MSRSSAGNRSGRRQNRPAEMRGETFTGAAHEPYELKATVTVTASRKGGGRPCEALRCQCSSPRSSALRPLTPPISQVERGKYLVTIAGCSDCHTPGYFLGKPDFSRTLGGSDVGFAIPGVRRVRRPQPDPRQGDRPRQLDRRPDHHGLHRRAAAGRAQACADHALAGTRASRSGGRRGDRRLSAQPAAGEKRGTRARSGRRRFPRRW